MKKLAIPAILAATILVAGAFAFMPVQQASTVHTTVLGATTEAQVFEVTVTDSNTGDIVTLDCDGQYIVTGLTATYAQVDAGDDIEVSAFGDTIVDIDGVATIENLMVIDSSYTPFGGDNGDDVIITFTDADDGSDENVDLFAYVLGADGLDCSFTQTTDA